METFPFILFGFHSDNGSEYINKPVTDLLEKLLIEFTKLRSRHSNDNALAESKNGAVVRKLFGYSHIPLRWASLINDFNQQYLNPYINFHHPCVFPETRIDDKGKQRKIYRYENMMTPYDKLKSLPSASNYLKPGVSSEMLDRLAHQISDNQAADLRNTRVFDQMSKGAVVKINTIDQHDFNVLLQVGAWNGLKETMSKVIAPYYGGNVSTLLDHQ